MSYEFTLEAARHQSGTERLAGTIAAAYGLMTPLKISVTFWFFQGAPAAGTLAVAALHLGLAYVVLLAGRLRPCAYALPRAPSTVKWILAFLAWSALTLFWSGADSRANVIGYVGLLAAELYIVWALLKKGEADRVATAFMQGYLVGCAALALMLILTGSYSAEGRLGNTEFLNPNSVGNQMAVGLLMGAALAMRADGRGRAKLLWVALAGTCAIGLVLAFSKTSMIAATVACLSVLVAGQSSAGKNLALLLSIGTVVVLFGGTIADQFGAYVEVNGGQALETASGRTLMWARTWEMIADEWLLGYGIGAFRDVGPQIFSIGVPHAHNEALHVWFSYGLVGVVISACIYGGFARQVFRAKASWHPGANIALMLIIFALLRGLAEAAYTGLVFPLPVLFLLSYWLSVPSEPSFGAAQPRGAEVSLV